MTEAAPACPEMFALDTLAQEGPAERGFLRSAWFAAGDTPADRVLIARDTQDAPLAGLVFDHRRIGPLSVKQVAGSYWPFRGIPLAPRANRESLARALRALRSEIGRIWRIGPLRADDPETRKLLDGARAAGWRTLERPVGQIFEIDLKTLKERGTWPSSRGAQKNRWRVRQIEKNGPVAIRSFTGSDWLTEDRDAIAEIERRSWVGQLEQGGDTKFADPAMRRFWEGICADPDLACMIHGMIMTVADRPIAFTFGLDCGPMRYCIANGYDQAFAKFSPGRVLLYADFEAAYERGIERIDWGLGDAGYKEGMGARPDAEMIDVLLVRPAILAALLRPLWMCG